MITEEKLNECDGVEVIKKLNRYDVGHLIQSSLHTTYKIAGGRIYYVDGRTFLSPDSGDDSFEVKLSSKVNEFVTDGSDLLFDILAFDSI